VTVAHLRPIFCFFQKTCPNLFQPTFYLVDFILLVELLARYCKSYHRPGDGSMNTSLYIVSSFGISSNASNVELVASEDNETGRILIKWQATKDIAVGHVIAFQSKYVCYFPR
jgi:hypothetical protein